MFDGEIILVNDEIKPFPSTGNLWLKETNSFENHSNKLNKIVFPTYDIKNNEIEDFLRIHIFELLKSNIILYDNLNMVILTKNWEDFSQIGFCVVAGEYPKIHKFGQKICDSFFKLRSFL